MNFGKNITKAILATFLMLTFAVTLVALPNANAAGVYTKKTYAFIGATPNPVGAGQETLLHIGISDEMQDVTHGYTGLTVTVEKPDGTTETLDNNGAGYRTDATGGTGLVYVPEEAGTYYLQTHFPAQWYNWTMYGGADIWFEASSSEKLALNVTEEPIPYYPSTPLPTDYWTRPIDAQHYDWYQVSGSWTTTPTNMYAPYNDGPETAHILWRNPLMIGGLVGGDTGNFNDNVGGGGQSPWSSSVILHGVLIYNKYYAGIERQVVAVDLHTGEELWVKNNSAVSLGQQFKFNAANQHAAFSYWWEITGGFDFFTGTMAPQVWNAYDPFTGRYVYSMTDVPSGTRTIGPNGEFYIYDVDLENKWVAMWNSTSVVTSGGGGGWQPDGSTYNASALTRSSFFFGTEDTHIWAWNATIPEGLPGSARVIYNDDVMLGYYRGGTVLTRVEAGITLDNPPFYAWAVSLEEESRGQLLWNKTYTLPPENLTITFGATSQEDRVWTVWCKETRSHTAYSMDTGEKLWESESQPYLDMYGIHSNIAYGKLYSSGYAGILYCYNATTGELLWTYEANDLHNEILWGNNWPLKVTFITDGKIYGSYGEHSPIAPLARGAPFICLNTTTGEEIWRIDGAFRGTEWGGNAIIGDSVIALWNSYDNYVYGISKGPSATTVNTSPKVSVQGSKVLVEGTVTDISPGTEEYGLDARFPNGVPAVSDDSMSDWMKYVYMQFARPANATGVEVLIDVLDANGNYRNIGSTTSDASGFFSFEWDPDIPGKYTVIARFAGSEAYWPSFAETAFTVEEPPEATPPPTPSPAPATDMYVLGSTAGIIVAIAVVGLVIVLMLRKR